MSYNAAPQRGSYDDQPAKSASISAAASCPSKAPPPIDPMNSLGMLMLPEVKTCFAMQSQHASRYQGLG